MARLIVTLLSVVSSFLICASPCSIAWAGGLSHLWSVSFGELERQESWSVAVDGAGNVLLTGLFEGTVDFGGGPLTSEGHADIFLVEAAELLRLGPGGVEAAFLFLLWHRIPFSVGHGFLADPVAPRSPEYSPRPASSQTPVAPRWHAAGAGVPAGIPVAG